MSFFGIGIPKAALLAAWVTLAGAVFAQPEAPPAASPGRPAILVLGDTYDPTTLARMGALGVKGEAAKARDYYAKALAAGMGAARERIAALEAQ